MRHPPARARSSRRAQRFLDRIAFAAVLASLSVVGAAAAGAEEISREQMKSLDEQVQEIKSDVLGIAAELNQLEERLLYPSNTQVAVFVSLAEGEAFRLDSVRIELDGELVAHHIYSFKELEALQRGGVQRIYTGNVTTGEHQLQVAITGKEEGGEVFTRDETFGFSKDVEPKLVEITLAGDAGIRLAGR